MLHRFMHTLLRPGTLGAFVLAMLLAPLTVRSATDSTTMAVTATVVSTCGITASPLAFGSYVMGQTDAGTSVVVTCTNGTTYTVSLSAGVGASATVGARKMTGPTSQTLTYVIYSDAGRTTVWGDTIGTNTVAGTGNGTPQGISAYGRIAASQTSGVGAYADTVTVTLTY